MAIIDYTSLKKIPYTQGKATNITAFESIQEGMTQPYRSDQCGAYALVAATATLGLFPVQEPLTLELKYPFGEFKDQTNEATLFKSDSFTLLAEKIYKITGILAQGEDSLIKACGYNAPAALISVAKQLGLKVEFVITEDQEKEFIAKFPNQLEWCKSVLYPNEIKIVNNDADTSPNEREVALTLMKTFVDSFHWIAQSSNNTYFDSLRNFYPGNQYGRVGNTWSSRPYTDTGMIIKLSK